MMRTLGSISRALNAWFLPIVHFPSQLPRFLSKDRSSELDFTRLDNNNACKYQIE